MPLLIINLQTAAIMKRISNLLMLLGLLLVGCNDDVFTDSLVQNDSTSITMDGDDGSASMSIPIKNLQSITLLHDGEDSKSYIKYFRAGNLAISNDAPASEISRIVFDNDISRLEITKDGKKLDFSSVCNASNADEYFTLQLTYDYGVKTIAIKTEPGTPLTLSYLSFGELMINDSVKVKSKVLNYDNKGESTVTIYNYPYEDELFTAHLDPLEFDWLRKLSLTMNVPAYQPLKWVSLEVAGITPGIDYQNLTWYHDNWCIQTHIPPMTGGYIQTDLVYSESSQSCEMIFRNEVLDRSLSAHCNLTTIWPTDFSITRYDSDGTVIPIGRW